MTRREVERVAAAVRSLAHDNALEASLPIGRAILGARGGLAVWKKWLAATGWPASIIPELARREAFHEFTGEEQGDAKD